MNIDIIAFDADDTLWDNEPLFQSIEKELCELLKEYGNRESVSSCLLDITVSNLEIYGYGAKSFTLSMIETALKMSKNRISSHIIELLINKGKNLLNMPIRLLDGVEESLVELNKKYKLVVATKGDLVDQQRKLNRSGLAKYFDHVEIMSNKTEKEYRRLVSTLNTQPENMMMIGNSLKSDIYPALSVGMYAVFVPYHTMWKHEVVEENIIHERLYKIESVQQLSQLILG